MSQPLNSTPSIDNDRLQKPHLFMCAPRHFVVTYKINPWMKPQEWQNNAPVLKEKAKEGWQSLYQTFQSLGVTIDLIEQQADLPDMVFTANSAVVFEGKALLSHFLHQERQGEEKYFLQYFQLLKEKGVLSTVDRLPPNLVQEGAGDCLWDNTHKVFWAGYGQRSSKESTKYLQDYFGQEVIALELASPRFYHIDVSLSPLNSGTIIYYPAAFTKQSQNIILERIPPEQLIAVDDQDAHNFVCNLVNIDDKIILCTCSSRLKNTLKDRGYTIIEIPVETFALAGGSVCCLTLRLNCPSY